MSFALVIDDNRQTANALVEMIHMLGLEARAVLNPAAAMGLMANEVPQVVFLDLNMPGVDGFEVLSYIKRDPRLTRVPVIVITSDDQPETAQRVLQNGGEVVLVKPIVPEQLESALQKVGLPR